MQSRKPNTLLNRESLMKLPEVAAWVAMSEARVRDLSRRALFPAPVRLGMRAIRWRPADVETWLASRPPA